MKDAKREIFYWPAKSHREIFNTPVVILDAAHQYKDSDNG